MESMSVIGNLKHVCPIPFHHLHGFNNKLITATLNKSNGPVQVMFWFAWLLCMYMFSVVKPNKTLQVFQDLLVTK